MFLNSLSNPTKKALEKLDSSVFFSQTHAYLAGGTALALHLGHRYSEDLDFFTRKKFIAQDILQLIAEIGRFQTNRVGWQTILGKFEDVKLSLFYYKYPLLAKEKIVYKNAKLASLEDIAAMKIAAIADRGTKRDFIDLFFLTKSLSLKEMLKFYNRKYKNLASRQTYILKSLFYFVDAEKDPMPEMIEKINWQEVKTFFEKEVKKIAKSTFYKQ